MNYDEDALFDERFCVWFEGDQGSFSDDSSGGDVAAQDEQFAVALFRTWWRAKRRAVARTKGQPSLFDPPLTDARH